MTRKTSLWSELRQERERRERAARARQKAEQQLLRQFTQDRERAARQAAKADAAECKRQEQLAHQAGAATASAMKAQLDNRLADLTAVLTSVLQRPPKLTFARLKRVAEVPDFDPGELGRPLPPPDWTVFAPPAPGALSGLLGGKARYQQALALVFHGVRELTARQQ